MERKEGESSGRKRSTHRGVAEAGVVIARTLGRGRTARDRSLASACDSMAKLARKGHICILRFGECLQGSYRSEQLINLEFGRKTLRQKGLSRTGDESNSNGQATLIGQVSRSRPSRDLKTKQMIWILGLYAVPESTKPVEA